MLIFNMPLGNLPNPYGTIVKASILKEGVYLDEISKIKFVKIIYFDEPSATDLIYITSGGKLQSTSEEIVTKATKLAADAEARAEAKIPFFNFFKAQVGVGSEFSVGREGQNVLSHVITSTMLTDYLDLVHENDDLITQFTNYSIKPYPESFSYYKILTPFMTMTEGKVDVGSDIKLNIAMMDQALEEGRGYYEMVAEKDSERCVLRFNIKAFRNNYSIADLVKMKLVYHAILVGSVDEDELKMENEFSQKTSELSGYEMTGDKKESEKLQVYDVLLAGICK